MLELAVVVMGIGLVFTALGVFALSSKVDALEKKLAKENAHEGD